MKVFLRVLTLILCLVVVIVFIASCIITQSDAQGVLVFIFSIPILALCLVVANTIHGKMKRLRGYPLAIDQWPKWFSFFLVGFFVLSFIPGVQLLPQAFLLGVGQSFSLVMGKTPYEYFKERASFPRKLEVALSKETQVYLHELDVTFAWDQVCIFGPYTNNAKAREVMKMDWNIEERSEIAYSDSINALVFNYQNKVNHVVDLKRS